MIMRFGGIFLKCFLWYIGVYNASCVCSSRTLLCHLHRGHCTNIHLPWLHGDLLPRRGQKSVSPVTRRTQRHRCHEVHHVTQNCNDFSVSSGVLTFKLNKIDRDELRCLYIRVIIIFVFNTLWKNVQTLQDCAINIYVIIIITYNINNKKITDQQKIAKNCTIK